VTVAIVKVIARGPQGPAGTGGGSGTLAGLSDVTGTAGTGKAPVSDGAGHFALTDVATQAELNAIPIQVGMGSPVGSVTPNAAGWLYLDLTNGALYLAVAATSADWVANGGKANDNTEVGLFTGHRNFYWGSVVVPASQRFVITGVTSQPGGLNTGNGMGWHDKPSEDGTRFGGSEGFIQTGNAGQFTHSWYGDGSYVFPAALEGPTWGVLINGAEYLSAISAPADSDIATNQRQQWYDATTGAPKLRIKERDAAGTLFEKISAVKETDGSFAMGAAKITGLADPTSPQDGATKAYADLKLAKASNLSDLASAATARTNLGVPAGSGTSTGTNTGDQTSVSGNAGTATALQTGRTIDGQTFDGTANITVIAPGTHAATSKATPVDADELSLVDSAASNVLKKLTWANLKATVKAYTDTLYAPVGGSASVRLSAANVTTAVQVVSSTAETDILNFTLPAGSLGANGVLRTVLVGDRLWNNNLADAITIRVYFGGTLVLAWGSPTAPGTVLSATRTPWRFNLEIRNLAATNSQWIDLFGSLVENASNTTGLGGLFNDLIGRRGGGGLLTSAAAAAIDTTASAVVRVSVQWNASSANDAWRLNHAYAELLT
jgi:hypothetical protein